MKPVCAVWLVGVIVACSGCALFQDGHRNMHVAFSTHMHAHREYARNKKWAEDAWQRTSMSDGFSARSSDYAEGFKDGYAEYLFRGGNTEPPLVAPLRYRHLRYQNEQGYHAIQDWFAGFRHGAHTAHDSGMRNLITGPSALRTAPPQANAYGVAPDHLPPAYQEVKSLRRPSALANVTNGQKPERPPKVAFGYPVVVEEALQEAATKHKVNLLPPVQQSSESKNKANRTAPVVLPVIVPAVLPDMTNSGTRSR